MMGNNFFAELKRRKVYKVAVAYAAIGWLLIQIATTTFPVLQIPAWAMRLVVVLVLLGFPIALVLAWAYEMTPDGIRRTHHSDAVPKQPSRWGGGWIVLVIVALAGAVWLFFGLPLPATLRERLRLSAGMKQDPAWISLRNDPRFEKLLASLAPK